jgi:two-component system OmpR family response regulator
MRLLLVEDDLPLAEALMSLLVSSGYAVDCVHDGEAAKALVAAEQFDLMILDLNLPHLDGLSVLRAMRASGNRAAVMILTARGTAEDRVRGLDLGADDYMAKPFDIREFEARVRSLLRRQAGLRSATVSLGALSLDLTTRQFAAHGQMIDLPPRERALLELLVTRAGKVVVKEAIVQSLTSLDDMLSDNAIEQYISRLRRRLAPLGLTLRTVRGIGYLLEKPAETPFAAPPFVAVAFDGHGGFGPCGFGGHLARGAAHGAKCVGPGAGRLGLGDCRAGDGGPIGRAGGGYSIFIFGNAGLDRAGQGVLPGGWARGQLPDRLSRSGGGCSHARRRGLCRWGLWAGWHTQRHLAARAVNRGAVHRL